MRLAGRMGRLGTETAFDVLVKARAFEAAGRDVIHLEIGEPDFDSPAPVVAAGQAALAEGHTHYGPAAGLPELRRAIAEWVGRSRGIEVEPTQVVVAPGAKPIIFFTALALLEAGDEAILPDPAFPIYESMVRFVGATPVHWRLREERDFRPDLTELPGLVTDRTRLLILNSPQNPTGGILTGADLDAIAAAVAGTQITVLADEIYSQMVYEGRHESLLTRPGLPKRTILLDGFSKTFAMTGWRIGYGVLPPDLVPHFDRLLVNSVSCTPAFVQHAAIAALAEGWAAAEAMMGEFRARRDYIVPALNAIPGISCRTPGGAFYVFPKVSDLGVPAETFADRLLNEFGVAALAGTAFGPGGAGHLRLSFANSLPNLRRAVDRIAACAEAVRGV
ncbi:MAG TPA: pyridoxal phosphate-dependent aminotransferase [Dehalococcoidia bacterium]|nr:pyridoxal phosphate-dependent aminotransferase [Dehalococcoidia bacterium]